MKYFPGLHAARKDTADVPEADNDETLPEPLYIRESMTGWSIFCAAIERRNRDCLKTPNIWMAFSLVPLIVTRPEIPLRSRLFSRSRVEMIAEEDQN